MIGRAAGLGTIGKNQSELKWGAREGLREATVLKDPTGGTL